MIFLEALLVGVLVWHVVTEFLHRKERVQLLDRLMARNLDEYKYFEQKFPQDVKTVTKANEKLIEQEIATGEQEDAVTKEFVSGLEEDWGTDTIDKTQLSEIIKERKIIAEK